MQGHTLLYFKELWIDTTHNISKIDNSSAQMSITQSGRFLFINFDKKCRENTKASICVCINFWLDFCLGFKYKDFIIHPTLLFNQILKLFV